MRLAGDEQILELSSANIVLLFESTILFCDFFCDFIAKYGDGFDVRSLAVLQIIATFV